MTEGAFQSKLLKALRSHPALKDAVIFKHSDMFTAGIPDISITWRSLTTWLELKVAPNRCSKIQLHYLAKLDRSWIVNLLSDGTIYFGDGKANPPMMPFDNAVDALAEWCRCIRA